MLGPLSQVLILLATAVFLVTLVRRLSLPTSLAYLLTGLLLGPHALAVVPDSGTTRLLAELGVAFLLFTLGLEFSLPRMLAMRREVFGLGALQVLATTRGVRRPRPAAVRAAMAHRHRARRRRGDELDRHPAAAAHRARRAQPHARPARLRDTAVPGPGLRAVPGPRRPARRRRGPLPARRERADAGRRRARHRGGARRGPLAAAAAVPRDRPQPPARAVHARGAAGGARLGLGIASRRPVVRARCVPRRHDARRDRVPAPDRVGHPPVPRHPASGCSSSRSACCSTCACWDGRAASASCC